MTGETLDRHVSNCMYFRDVESMLVRGLQDVHVSPAPSPAGAGGRGQYLLVTTTGAAAEYWGNRFGLYKEAGTHNGAPYYVQLHDVNTEEEPYKFCKYDDVGWVAGPVLGGCQLSAPGPSQSLWATSTTLPLSSSFHHLSIRLCTQH